MTTHPELKLGDVWPYGDLYVLEALWERLGIRKAIEERLVGRKIEFPVERALFAMVANRTCAPSSKLYAYEQWIREDVRIKGAKALELQHLYRAMDFFEVEKDAIEKSVFFSVSDLLNLDVDLIFYDTTSLHFEITQEDEAEEGSETVEGSQESGGKKYAPLRQRGYAKNDRTSDRRWTCRHS